MLPHASRQCILHPLKVSKIGKQNVVVKCCTSELHVSTTVHKNEALALQEEHTLALRAARSCSARSERLHAKAIQLKSAALKALQQGDEGSARKILELKAKVQEAAMSSNMRALANATLAVKLAEVILQREKGH
ncbi:hypothetical protein COCOBI_01-5560 [Coccomyxa sp. Obi]|nr:hypothetical protein COCOBI_01-5560 [Coccomyxa sp. Obi]